MRLAMTRQRATIIGIMILATILAILVSTQYSTGTTLDTQLFPYSKYWSITTLSGNNIVCLTVYTPQVAYLAIGDRLTVSYVDNN